MIAEPPAETVDVGPVSVPRVGAVSPALECELVVPVVAVVPLVDEPPDAFDAEVPDVPDGDVDDC